MADGEERAVSEREVAPLAPLIWITAGVSLLAAIPVMLLFAVAAGLLGALAAAVVGVPIAALARRWELRSVWHAAALGLGAAMLAGSAAGLLAGVRAFVSDPTPRGYVAGMMWQFGLVAAPFGVAAGVVFWARHVSTGWASRNLLAVATAAVVLTAMVFILNHEIR